MLDGSYWICFLEYALYLVLILNILMMIDSVHEPNSKQTG